MAQYGLIAKILLDSARIAAAAQRKREQEAARAARAKAAAEQRARAGNTPGPAARRLADARDWAAPNEYKGVPVNQRPVRPPISDPRTLAEFRGQAPPRLTSPPPAPAAPVRMPAPAPPCPAPAPALEPEGEADVRDKVPRPLLIDAGRLVTTTRRTGPDILQEELHISASTAHHVLLTLQRAGIVRRSRSGAYSAVMSPALFELTLATTASGTVDAVVRRQLELQLTAEAARAVACGRHAFPELLEQRLGVSRDTAVALLGILERHEIVGPEHPDRDREVLMPADLVEEVLVEMGIPPAGRTQESTRIEPT